MTLCVAPERSYVSAVWPLFGAVCLAQPLDNQIEIHSSRFLAVIGGPASPCGVDMEIESRYDLFFLES